MYEAKYSKHITQNKSRFATAEEIIEDCVPVAKYNKTKGCGAPLYYDGKKLYVDTSDAHYYTQGQTGSKKSRIVETTIINSIIGTGENFVVNDPKGEAYRRTANYARDKGYNVRVLNLRDVSKSNGWNPLSIVYKLYSEGNMPEAEQMVNDIVEAIMTPAKEKTNDLYWAENGGMGLTYFIESLMDSVPPSYFNIANVIQLSHESNGPVFRKMMESMDESTSCVMAMHSVLDVTAEKTASCIYSTIKQVLKPFTQNKSLLELLCEDEISYSELTEKKTAIYIIYPDEKKTLNFLITLFLTQCYQYLVNYSTKFSDSRLPIRVNFVLDEFSNLPCIDNFDNCISEARGHNIRYFLFGQSKGQLKNKYGDIANTIISNCEWIIFPSKEYSFLDTVSKMCGREYDYYGNEHDLLSVCDIQHLKKYDDGAEVLILKSGQFPFVTKLPDYEYVDIFNHYPDAAIEDVSRRAKAKYITFGEWIDGFGGKFKFPFLAGKKNTNKG